MMVSEPDTDQLNTVFQIHMKWDECSVLALALIFVYSSKVLNTDFLTKWRRVTRHSIKSNRAKLKSDCKNKTKGKAYEVVGR